MPSWLMIAAGDARQHAGNDGYDDLPDSHYSWDNTVANHASPAAGDTIVLWDKQQLLGMSVIERIERSRGPKVRRRCPGCNQTKLRPRSRTSDFRCSNCHTATKDGVVESIDVDRYTSRHAAAWINLLGVLTGNELRELCASTKSQQSLRPLDASKFAEALHAAGHDPAVGLLACGRLIVQGGHTVRLVRARRGQRAFRSKLVLKYGAECAFTGPAPAVVLEAAHLYSYAKVGEHKDGGGLLLRRDVHRVFDLGLLTVDSSGAVVVHKSLLPFELYAELSGRKLRVPIPSRMAQWFALHATQHDVPSGY